ncbi:MAG: LysR family transcriptional regulator [Christensenellales bacterium]|jgi:LysR family cyn operon transcriptional activator
MKVSFDLYRVFRVSAKAGSLSKAAGQLYISQPAVSQAIKQLEDRLGVALFLRNSRGITLTAEGEALYGYIDQACGLIEAGELHINQLKTLAGGEIRIGASDTLCKHYLLAELDKYHKKYPDINISVTNRTSFESLELLRAGQVDIAFLNMPIAAEGVVVRSCYRVSDGFVCGEKFRRLAGSTLSWEELSRLPLLLLEKASNSRRYLDDQALKAGVTLQPVIELGSHDVLADFARIGLGVAGVTKQFVQKELDSNELFEIGISPPIPTRHIGLATMRNISLSFAAQCFVDDLLNLS